MNICLKNLDYGKTGLAALSITLIYPTKMYMHVHVHDPVHEHVPIPCLCPCTNAGSVQKCGCDPQVTLAWLRCSDIIDGRVVFIISGVFVLCDAHCRHCCSVRPVATAVVPRKTVIDMLRASRTSRNVLN